jgi:hypothetical protein
MIQITPQSDRTVAMQNAMTKELTLCTANELFGNTFQMLEQPICSETLLFTAQ